MLAINWTADGSRNDRPQRFARASTTPSRAPSGPCRSARGVYTHLAINPEEPSHMAATEPGCGGGTNSAADAVDKCRRFSMSRRLDTIVHRMNNAACKAGVFASRAIASPGLR